MRAASVVGVTLTVGAGQAIGSDSATREFKVALAAAFRAQRFDRSLLGGLGGFKTDHDALRDALSRLDSVRRKLPSPVNATAAIGALMMLFADPRADLYLKFTLKLKPRQYLAQLAYGILHNEADILTRATRCHPFRAGGWLALARTGAVGNHDSAEALRRALRLQPSSRHVVGAVGEGLRRLGNDEEAKQVFDDASRAGLWRSPLQRPRSIFWPRLRSSPLPHEELEVSWPLYSRARQAMEAAIGVVEQEFQRARVAHPPQDDRTGEALSYWVQNCDNPWGCSYKFTVLDAPERGQGKWAEYTIWCPLRLQDAVCQWGVFPETCSLVQHLRERGVPVTRLSVTEVYPPRTVIPRHHSPNQGRLRMLCPLNVAEGSRSRLSFGDVAELSYGTKDKGRCFWFDESFEHELHYEGDGPRASLILDVPHPALVEAVPPLEPILEAPDDAGSPTSLVWAALMDFARDLGVHASWTGVT